MESLDVFNMAVVTYEIMNAYVQTVGKIYFDILNKFNAVVISNVKQMNCKYILPDSFLC